MQPCFTNAAAEAFIERQSHNYRHLRVYVTSGYDNPEWRIVRDWLMSLTPAINGGLVHRRFVAYPGYPGYGARCPITLSNGDVISACGPCECPTGLERAAAYAAREANKAK